jgi:membrane-associated phospholipid phosphatase
MRAMGRLFLAIVLVALGLLLPGAARADEATAPSLHWDPAWTHAGPADYALTGIGLAGVGLEVAFLQSKQPPLRWTGPILFDDAVRDVLRGSTPEVRATATTASWIALGVVTAYPLLVDVPYAGLRYKPAVAWDLFWQDTTALSLATAADMGLRDLVGRARPPVSDCLAAGGSTSQCLGDNTEATRAFPGGHMVVATTGAVLVCTQHLSLELYGAPWDAVACGAAIAADAAVGTLRIVTDNHWASDVVAGSALGFAFGWGVPFAMHLHGHAGSPDTPQAVVVPFPIALDHGAGLGFQGIF